ncbi:MAG: phosphoribosylamine--glycine ligase [Candidatus Krumholzibacteria bacterium]|nr:phosphoribosylamine--glycine ligase [Candidatus Krumholzibacteria bacterium]
MKVLIVGGGGREHALAWSLARSPLVETVYAAPGNAGISRIGRCVPLGTGDHAALLDLARREKIDLTVVGPEEPLVRGIVDLFRREKQRIFGFDSKGALLEGSKVWAKEFMSRYRIPTGRYSAFDDHCAAQSAVGAGTPPFVIKADGLAAGKGVVICRTAGEAREAIEAIMRERRFGVAGERVVVEEFLEGPELSMLVVFDGRDYRLFPPSQDHKRAHDGDTGPNTGGMGAYAPVEALDRRLEEKIRIEIIEPTLSGMQAEKIAGAGVIYFGLMLTPQGPKVLEYNCRFGDPETQAILPLLRTDLFEVLYEATNANLESVDFETSDESCACVVIASGGYPGEYVKGREIAGIEEAERAGCLVFHAGTALRDGRTVTAGGRVLGVTAVAPTLREAVEAAYGGVDRISFDGCFARRDIGWRALEPGRAAQREG